jgi:hypothetical protein
LNGKPIHIDTKTGSDDQALKELQSRVGDLEAAFENLKGEFSHWMKILQDALNGKADKNQLTDLENSILFKLNDIVAAMTKTLADKADTKKALKLLER